MLESELQQLGLSSSLNDDHHQTGVVTKKKGPDEGHATQWSQRQSTQPASVTF